MSRSGNLFAGLGPSAGAEQFVELLSAPGIRIERIVSAGQATPAEEWLRQEWTEWVVLLAGSAAIQLSDEAVPRTLCVGDWLELPARLRHRVEWTDPDVPTIWLAVHFAG